VEQCRAEYSAWRINKPADAANLLYPELLRRSGELNVCAATYLTEIDNRNWVVTADAYDVAAQERLVNFVIRHKLSSSFLREDEGGAR
jgi:hypothetical protein